MIVRTLISFVSLLLGICWATKNCPPALFFEPTGLTDLLDKLNIPDFEELVDSFDLDDIAEHMAQQMIKTNLDLFRKYVIRKPTGYQERGGHPIDIIKKDGYKGREYNVTTEDGYIISLHRIFPRGYNTSSPEKETKTVYLGHGLLGSSADWLMVDKGRALPYLLSNAGYDVWMGNARGNAYSRTHKKDKKNNEYYHHMGYWNFSVHEMGIIDLPAKIETVLRETGVKQINYIGYSMSTTYFHIMLSEHQTYNDRIRRAVSLAPCVYANNIESPTKCILALQNNIRAAVYVGLSRYAYYGIEAANQASPNGVCGTEGSYRMCHAAINSLAGESSEPNRTVLKYAQYYFPTMTSAKTVNHFIQYFQRDKFRQYDYGTNGNRKRYNSNHPPMYKLNNTLVDMKVFYGKTDRLTVVQDVRRTVVELKAAVLREGTIEHEMVNDRNGKFNHLDFYYHDDAWNLVYKPLIKYLNS